MSAAAQPPATPPETAAAAPAPPPVLTFLTSGDPQTQFMALTLTLASQSAGASAELVLCSAAGDLALIQPPPSATAPIAPRGTSPRQLLDMLMTAGAVVNLCPIYLPERRLDRSAIIAGVTITTPQAGALAILDPQRRLLSF